MLVTGQVQTKKTEAVALIRAEAEAVCEALARRMTNAMVSATRVIVEADERSDAAAFMDNGSDVFSLDTEETTIATAQELCSQYQKAITLCTEALSLDPARRTWSMPQRTKLEALLVVAKENAQAHALLARAQKKMLSSEFAQAAEILADALEALPSSKHVAGINNTDIELYPAANATQVQMPHAVGERAILDTDTVIPRAAKRQWERIAALRAMALKKAAETDLRNRGKAAMRRVDFIVRQVGNDRNAPAPRILELVPRHDPHPYWNPSESDRRDPSFLGNSK